MCGICGIYNLDGKPVNAELLQRMNATLAHRGPDGSGTYISSHIGLGHRRLSIIDLETGTQPMPNEDGSIHVVFNGEIYNFKELKKELEARGHHFATRSDTEAIIHGYEEWGDDFVGRLRGMFAIGLWDANRQKVMLVRDRIGKKPLFYSFDGHQLVFASELKAILADAAFPKQIDAQALDSYLSFGYVPSPLSIFMAIRKLPPAHVAVCTPHGFSVREYWHLDIESQSEPASEERAIEQLLSVFDESVRIRLISDVPLGAFLSGGFDSSAVVASMAKLTDGVPIKTTSIGFSDEKFDELNYARIVASFCSTDHTEFVVTPDALSVLDRIVWHLDEPFADASAIPTYYVSKLARQRVTVALSGDGGDEVFAGYVQRYTMNRFEDKIRRRLPYAVRDLCGWIARFYPKTHRLPRPLRLKAFLSNISKSFEEAYFRDISFYFLPDIKRLLYRPEFASSVGEFDPFGLLKTHFNDSHNSDATTRAQYLDIKTYLPEDILVKVDRMSMAHALEVRSPFLDHEMIQFAASLPSSLKLRGKQAKYILKKSMHNRLPAEILARRKQGFSVPLAGWLRGQLREFASETLFDSNTLSNQYLNQPYVRHLWKMHLRGLQDNSSQLWAIIMLTLWHRKFCT